MNANDRRYALNSITPYYTMFPLKFPFSILQRHGNRGEWVLDPFCGRGTTNYAARLLGMPSIGIDSNPVATAISWAKLANVLPEQVVQAAQEVLEEIEDPHDIPNGEFWEWAYHPDVLHLLCRFREGLLLNANTDARRALRAVIMGGLHGTRNKVEPSYFSNQCQRSYAPKPDYAIKYWKERQLTPQPVDVLKIILTRATRAFEYEKLTSTGFIVNGDSRNSLSYTGIQRGQVRWIITSPPYYGMRTYLPDQWLRLWFVGGSPKVDYRNTNQLEHTSPEEFAQQLGSVWKNLGNVSTSNARLVIRFGSLNDRKVHPFEVISSSLKGTGWKILTRHSAGTAADGKRQAQAFARHTPSEPQEEFDIWAKWNG